MHPWGVLRGQAPPVIPLRSLTPQAFRQQSEKVHGFDPNDGARPE
jgi:hypothetical protein